MCHAYTLRPAALAAVGPLLASGRPTYKQFMIVTILDDLQNMSMSMSLYRTHSRPHSAVYDRRHLALVRKVDQYNSRSMVYIYS